MFFLSVPIWYNRRESQNYCAIQNSIKIGNKNGHRWDGWGNQCHSHTLQSNLYMFSFPVHIWFAISEHQCFLEYKIRMIVWRSKCWRYSADDDQVCMEFVCWDHKIVYCWTVVTVMLMMMAEGGNSWFAMPSILEVIIIYIEQKRPSVHVSMVWLECIKLKSTIIRTRTQTCWESEREREWEWNKTANKQPATNGSCIDRPIQQLIQIVGCTKG